MQNRQATSDSHNNASEEFPSYKSKIASRPRREAQETQCQVRITEERDLEVIQQEGILSLKQGEGTEWEHMIYR